MTDFSLYYSIGSTIGGVQTFDALGLIAPFQDAYLPYSVEVDAMDGLVYGYGRALTAFRWGFITQTHRNLLKTYCPNKSAVVYVRLRDEGWNWDYCRAVMIWGPENPPIRGLIVDFQIALRILENYGASLP